MPLPDRAIPVTVLTGFLGAGKTTLLNYLLKAEHGYKIAVIVNEFGAVDIDSQLIEKSSEKIVGLSNGCICCTMRSDLLSAIRNLFEGDLKFDYLVIETTGMADPAPIVQTFFNIPDIHRAVKMDAIVTVVDCDQIEKQMKQSDTAISQVQAADFLVLSKLDLVDPPKRQRVEKLLRKVNSDAMFLESDHGKVDLSLLLDVDAFDVERHLTRDPEFLDELIQRHDQSVTSCAFELAAPIDLEKFKLFIDELGNSPGEMVLRSKGIVASTTHDRRIIFHGVNNRFTMFADRPWEPGETRRSQLVFIGKGFTKATLEPRIKKCTASRILTP